MNFIDALQILLRKECQAITSEKWDMPYQIEAPKDLILVFEAAIDVTSDLLIPLKNGRIDTFMDAINRDDWKIL